MYTEDNNDLYSEYVDEYSSPKNNKKKTDAKYVIIAIILVVILLLLILLLTKGCQKSNNNENKIPEKIIKVNLSSEVLTIKEKETLVVNVQIENKGDGTVTWYSNDENIVTVDNTGMITGIKEGTTSIAVVYTDTNGVTYSDDCNVTVIKDNTNKIIDNTKPNITYTFSGGIENTWGKNNVSVTVEATDNVKISSLKYALDCTNNCSYINIENGSKVDVTKEGTTILTIIASDDSGNTITKMINIKIDKTKPVCVINKKINDNNITLNVTVSDTMSGIKTVDGSNYSGLTVNATKIITSPTTTIIKAVDNALNETICNEVKTMTCYKYNTSNSCKISYACKEKDCDGICYSDSNDESFRECEDNGAYYIEGRCYYTRVVPTYFSSCERFGYVSGTLKTVYSSDSNLKSTKQTYYKQTGSKLCVDACMNSNCENS